MLHSPLAVIHDFADGRGWLTVYGGQGEFSGESSTRVNWYDEMGLALSKRMQASPPRGSHGLVVPGVGRCTALDVSGKITVGCLSPMPRTSVALELPNGARHWIAFQTKSGIPEIDFIDFRPLKNFSAQTTFSVTELNGARLIQGNLVGFRDADFYFHNIRFADYLPKHQ